MSERTRGAGRTTARRLFNSILASEWAIHPEWLRQFATLASRLEAEGSGTITAEEIRTEIRRTLAQLNEEREGRPVALAYSYGAPLGEDTNASVRDGVAIIPVVGPLYHYADELHNVCGCSSYAQIARDIAAVRAARAADPSSIKAVIFEVDSPGGEVGGITEAAAMIAELAAEIPTAVFVADLGASAAYWLSSAGGEIVAAPIARLGSIGVVAAYRAKGTDGGVVEIVSSQSPKKRPDIATEEGRAQIQATVDALADVFVAAVAENRGVDVETVLSDFGQGDVLVGARAVEAGLADRIGTFEQLLADMASGKSGAGRRPRQAAAAGGLQATSTTEEPVDKSKETPAAEAQPAKPITIESIAADHPQVAEQLRAEGATKERARILGIQEYGVAGHEALIAECVNDPTCTPEGAAAKVLKAERAKTAAEGQRGKDHLAKLQADEEQLEKPAAAAPAEPSSEEKQAGEMIGVLSMLGRTKKTAAK